MELLTLLQKAINYIENNLENDIAIDDIANEALISKYHFQRMFHVLTGFTVTEYLRNRRLTLAAEDIVSSDKKIIDIALKYAYETPESFSKAFQRLHGVTPLVAKRANVKLKSYPKLSFHIQIKGETEMNFRIVEEKGYKVIGTGIIIKNNPYTEIPAFVEEIWTNGTLSKIKEVAGQPQSALEFGYHYDFSEDGTRRYLMGSQLREEITVPEDLVLLDIPTQTYAVFESSEKISEHEVLGLEIMNVWQRIYSEWFPSSNFEQTEGPCIEKYYWSDESENESICEVWVPIRRKKE